MRLLRKFLLGLCLAALAITLALGLGILVPRPFAVPADAGAVEVAGEQTRRVLVLSNAIHTDIALPADPDVLQALSFVSGQGLELDYPGVFWVVVGWGSRSFYIETPTWSDLKAGPVFNALTWDESVMHLRRAGAIWQDHDSVRAVDLNTQEFDRLLSGITGSFQSGENATPQAITGSAYDGHDIFFPATGGFNALLGCNTWTARMLRQAGLTTGIWTPLPSTLNWSLELHNAH